MVGLSQITPRHRSSASTRPTPAATSRRIADILFSRYVFAFEVTSALLITAAVGAMVLAHRERLEPKPTQASLAAQRLRDYADSRQAPRPAARPPACSPATTRSTPRRCCPTARPSEASVSRVLAARGTVRSAPAMADDIAEIEQQIAGAHHAGRESSTPASTERGGSVHDPLRRPVLDPVHDRLPSGVLTRRNAIVVFMCVELMLNASNLALVAFAKQNGNLDGQIAAFFVMVVAAAEVVVGLAIIMTIFRTRRSASVDDASLLKY